jgi:hypothetical protein
MLLEYMPYKRGQPGREGCGLQTSSVVESEVSVDSHGYCELKRQQLKGKRSVGVEGLCIAMLIVKLGAIESEACGPRSAIRVLSSVLVDLFITS